MSHLRQLVKTAMTTVLPSRLFLACGPARSTSAGTVVDSRQLPPAQQVALTFDDGPHPEHTPRLLDYLAASAARATFFVVGESAQRYPHLIRRIVNEGHELGNHTFTHSEPNSTSTREFVEEVRRTRLLLQDLTGQNCGLTRPPKGILTLGKLWGLWSQRQTIVLWNIEPRDHLMRSRKQMERWSDAYLPRQGDIVLMHDNHPFASTAVEKLTGRPKLNSSQFVRISDWVSAAPMTSAPAANFAHD